MILAIPKGALQQVDWISFKSPNTARLIDTTANGKASKVFLLYPYRWWLTLPHPSLRLTHTRSDLPNRQTYDFGQSFTGNAVLLISYVDGELDVGHWNYLQKSGRCASRICDSNMVTDKVIRHAHIYLSRIYNISISNIPNPIDGVMKTWDDYPYYSGWGTWKPGVNFLQGFTDIMKPNNEHEVYILSGNYGTRRYTGWGEGSLHSGDILLEKYFGIPNYVNVY